MVAEAQDVFAFDDSFKEEKLEFTEAITHGVEGNVVVVIPCTDHVDMDMEVYDTKQLCARDFLWDALKRYPNAIGVVLNFGNVWFKWTKRQGEWFVSGGKRNCFLSVS